jgi:hypothetical protein
MDSSLTAYQLACLVHQEQGIPVFPVDLRYDTVAGKWQKQPLVKWSQVSGGPEDVTWHGANAVGVPMGQRSGLIALDIDSYKPGSEAEAWVRGHYLPPTREHRTASGGRHLIFRLPDGVDLGNQAPKVHGLDVRGRGGFIVWADTLGQYSVRDARAPALLPTSVQGELAALQRRGAELSDCDMPCLERIDEEDVDRRLQRLLDDPRKRPFARRFWGHLDGLKDRSRSARDMSIAGYLANEGFTFSEIVFVLENRFQFGTVARDGRTEKTERGVQRCAALATRQVQERDEIREEAMRARWAQLNARLPTTLEQRRP